MSFCFNPKLTSARISLIGNMLWNLLEQSLDHGQTTVASTSFLSSFLWDFTLSSVVSIFNCFPNCKNVLSYHLSILVLFLSFLLNYVFIILDERSMSFLYTQKKFKWSLSEFSDFRTVQTGIYAVGMYFLSFVNVHSFLVKNDLFSY